MSIRTASAHDFYYVRRLPVQLSKRSVFMLPPKTLRLLMMDADARLLVYERVDIAAFLALRIVPPENAGLRFLEIVYFACDRAAPANGNATKMIGKATEIAAQLGCAGVLVLNEQLHHDSLRFYQRAGFTPSENTLLKKINRSELAHL